MRDKKILTWPVIILIIVIPFVIGPIWSALTGHSAADVQEKIEDYLYEKYGEEFVVDRIGTRSSRGEEFYQARIYPKSIIGTNREGDDYYYASASVGIESFGRLGGVGDSYPLVNLKLGIEEHITPPAKDIFGERILMNIEAHYKRREPGNETFWGYKVDSFEKAREEIAKDPENRMIELELYVYIFDRIDNEEEKEERRKQIFNFVQYLKQEDLFEYLEMRIYFIDERVLAPSYDIFKRDIYISDKVKKYIKEVNTTVELPSMELRKKMSKDLQKEVNEMSENKILNNIHKLQKDDLSYRGIRKYNNHFMSYIYSKKILMERYGHNSDYEKIKDYDNLSDIYLTDNLEYVYVK